MLLNKRSYFNVKFTAIEQVEKSDQLRSILFEFSRLVLDCLILPLKWGDPLITQT